MRTYSMDLRERVVAACDRGDGTRRHIAERFCVSVAWVHRLLQRRRHAGSIAPKPRGGGRTSAFDTASNERLRTANQAHQHATLAELRDAAGVACSLSAVDRAVKRLGLTRKKSRGGRPSRTAPN